jgi:sugar-specific transcriptional regulator TrmB
VKNLDNIHSIISIFKGFGFTEYEVKVYTTLLEQNPLNGNMIALKSGVPGPKVYETLRKMKEKGVIYEVTEGDRNNQKRYGPLPYQDLLNNIMETLTDNIADLGHFLEGIEQKSESEWTDLFHISGYEASVATVKNFIKEADQEVILSCWNHELEKLLPELKNAYERKVHVVTIVFDAESVRLPWRHFIHANVSSAHSRHSDELSCVIDLNKAVVLNSSEGKTHAIVSSHQAMIKTTRNYIRHDIYVNRIMQDYFDLMKERYGKNLEILISDF